MIAQHEREANLGAAEEPGAPTEPLPAHSDPAAEAVSVVAPELAAPASSFHDPRIIDSIEDFDHNPDARVDTGNVAVPVLADWEALSETHQGERWFPMSATHVIDVYARAHLPRPLPAVLGHIRRELGAMAANNPNFRWNGPPAAGTRAFWYRTNDFYTAWNTHVQKTMQPGKNGMALRQQGLPQAIHSLQPYHVLPTSFSGGSGGVNVLLQQYEQQQQQQQQLQQQPQQQQPQHQQQQQQQQHTMMVQLLQQQLQQQQQQQMMAHFLQQQQQQQQQQQMMNRFSWFSSQPVAVPSWQPMVSSRRQSGVQIHEIVDLAGDAPAPAHIPPFQAASLWAGGQLHAEPSPFRAPARVSSSSHHHHPRLPASDERMLPAVEHPHAPEEVQPRNKRAAVSRSHHASSTVGSDSIAGASAAAAAVDEKNDGDEWLLANARHFPPLAEPDQAEVENMMHDHHPLRREYRVPEHYKRAMLRFSAHEDMQDSLELVRRLCASTIRTVEGVEVTLWDYRLLFRADTVQVHFALPIVGFTRRGRL